MIELRKYQINLKNKTRNAFKKYKRVIMLAPCGAGKTVIASSIMQDSIKKGKKVWFIVHRRELENQAHNTLERYEIPKDNIKIYMAQSLARKLNNIDEIPDLIIFDECQHCTSNTYLKIINKFPNTYILGLTATPTRLMGKPLGDVFETIVSEVTARQLINMGYLSSYDYYAPPLDLNLSNVKIRKGDYDSDDLDKEMSKKKIYGDIIKTYKKLANNKKTIIYCHSVEYSKKIEDLFTRNGYSIKHFDGTTPSKERDKIIEDFRNDKIQILTNVDLIGEGFDVPSCDCVLLLRPTQSLCLYIQSSTRCLRKNGNNKSIIIDYVGNIQRHGSPTMDREWRLDKKVKDYINENDDGTLKIRVCQECFGTFQTAPVCPYCGAVYETTPIEIQNFKEIELKKIEEEKAIRMQKYRETIEKKVANYKGPRECKNYMELVSWCKVKGYSPKYAFVLNQNLKLNFKIGGK